MNCGDAGKQLVTKIIFLAVAVFCTSALAGCSKPETRVLDNGKTVVVTRYRDGSVRSIRLQDEARRDALRIEIDSADRRTQKVTFRGRNGEKLDETTFESDGVSGTSGPIYFDYQRESDSHGTKLNLTWTYEKRHVVYFEKVEYGDDGRLVSRMVHGPYDCLLEDYHSGNQKPE